MFKENGGDSTLPILGLGMRLNPALVTSFTTRLSQWPGKVCSHGSLEGIR